MNNASLLRAQTALAGFTISAGGAAVSWMDHVEQWFRIGSSVIACVTGLAALVFYGKQNGWWK
jgi:hypothetical protein